MWIQVRSMDGRRSVRVDNLSKLTHIEELRERLVEHFQATHSICCPLVQRIILVYLTHATYNTLTHYLFVQLIYQFGNYVHEYILPQQTRRPQFKLQEVMQ